MVYQDRRKKAFLGSIISGVIGIGSQLIGNAIQNKKQREANEAALIEQKKQQAYQDATAMNAAYNNQEYVDAYKDKITFRAGGSARLMEMIPVVDFKGKMPNAVQENLKGLALPKEFSRTEIIKKYNVPTYFNNKRATPYYTNKVNEDLYNYKNINRTQEPIKNNNSENWDVNQPYAINIDNIQYTDRLKSEKKYSCGGRNRKK